MISVIQREQTRRDDTRVMIIMRKFSKSLVLHWNHAKTKAPRIIIVRRRHRRPHTPGLPFSLVDESVVGGGPVDELFRFEPESDLLLGGFLRVRAVDDVTTQIQAKVTTDRTRQGGLRIGFSHHHSASFGGILAFPNHRHHGTRGHEVTKTLVKGLVLEINVVLLEMLFGSLHELHGDELEAALLESLDDIADESALNSIRLHHDESAFGVSGHFSFGRAICAEV